MESISQLAWAVPLLVAVLTYLSLTILILNKTLSWGDPMFFCLLGSGFILGLFSVLCRAVQSSL